MGQRQLRRHYVYSILATLAGLSLHLLLDSSMNLVAFMVAAPSIYLITSFWGFYPALVSIFIWTLSLPFYFEPLYSFHVFDPREAIHLLVFLLTSIPVSFLVDRRRKFELKHIEDLFKLEHKNFQLAQEHRLRDEFVSTLSHDLRTPLTIARLSGEMALKFTEDPKLQKLIQRQIASLGRIDHMISNLLESRRLSLGNVLDLNRTHFSLSILLQRICDSYTILNTGRVLLVKSDSDLTVDWSEDHILRAVENLINNALKYGASDIPVEFGYNLKGKHQVEIFVKNMGPPIAPENLKIIFRPFHRLENHSTSKKGWGIGLGLVDEIVRSHKGTVSVTSTEHDGTRFVMMIPVSP